MSLNAVELKEKLSKLREIFVSATPFLTEGFAISAGASELRRRESNATEIKSSAKDLVTHFDKKVEGYLLQLFKQTFPNDAVIGEESVAQLKQKSDGFLKNFKRQKRVWIFDPIDGTTNFSKAYPFFCSTAAFIEYSEKTRLWEPLVGAVWNPVSREMFSAAQGCGAWLNRERLKVSQTESPLESLLITGFASERSTEGMRAFDLFTKITKKTLGVRRDGSAALDLAYVATGRVEAFWEWGLAPWDVAAGTILVREAGGKVTNLSGGAVDIERGEIIASNSKLHKWLVDSIKESAQ
jgi:myo-inositol-1(or 4)-monophosphatase